MSARANSVNGGENNDSSFLKNVLFIYDDGNDGTGEEEDTLGEKLLFFYPPTVSISQRINLLGTCLSFSSFATSIITPGAVAGDDLDNQRMNQGKQVESESESESEDSEDSEESASDEGESEADEEEERDGSSLGSHSEAEVELGGFEDEDEFRDANEEAQAVSEDVMYSSRRKKAQKQQKKRRTKTKKMVAASDSDDNSSSEDEDNDEEEEANLPPVVDIVMRLSSAKLAIRSLERGKRDSSLFASFFGGAGSGSPNSSFSIPLPPSAVLVVGASATTPDAVVRQLADTMRRALLFNGGPLRHLSLRCGGNRLHFAAEMAQVGSELLPFAEALHVDRAHSFEPVPFLEFPDGCGIRSFLLASQILDSIQCMPLPVSSSSSSSSSKQKKKMLQQMIGCIMFEGSVVCSQLDPEITRFILARVEHIRATGSPSPNSAAGASASSPSSSGGGISSSSYGSSSSASSASSIAIDVPPVRSSRFSEASSWHDYNPNAAVSEDGFSETSSIADSSSMLSSRYGIIQQPSQQQQMYQQQQQQQPRLSSLIVYGRDDQALMAPVYVSSASLERMQSDMSTSMPSSSSSSSASSYQAQSSPSGPSVGMSSPSQPSASSSSSSFEKLLPRFLLDPTSTGAYHGLYIHMIGRVALAILMPLPHLYDSRHISRLRLATRSRLVQLERKIIKSFSDVGAIAPMGNRSSFGTSSSSSSAAISRRTSAFNMSSNASSFSSSSNGLGLSLNLGIGVAVSAFSPLPSPSSSSSSGLSSSSSSSAAAMGVPGMTGAPYNALSFDTITRQLSLSSSGNLTEAMDAAFASEAAVAHNTLIKNPGVSQLVLRNVDGALYARRALGSEVLVKCYLAPTRATRPEALERLETGIRELIFRDFQVNLI